MKNSFSRTQYCGELTKENIGNEVSVCGWASKVRDHGGVVFIDLRDRTGIVQCTINEGDNKDYFDIASTVRTEFVLCIKGKVVARDENAVNPKLPTGEIEIVSTSIEILSKAETTPFEISDDVKINDQVRLKYRYLDLRRPSMQKNLALRHRVTQIARNYFDETGFLEIETPMLTKSTPEGARDYLVPSRVHAGKFYALPQSPQQYKQLLMLSGFDRYMQITRCFRDEDLRADRQPEFTQIDLEMSFVDAEDVMSVNEGFLKRVLKEVLDVDVALPLPRMPYKEAMDRFGSDKPDTRFGYEICDISDIAEKCSFKVFNDPIAKGGTVRVINMKGLASRFPRKEIDNLLDFVKIYRAKGLAWLKLLEGTQTSSFAKFLTEDELSAIMKRVDFTEGDILFGIGDSDAELALVALGELRLEIAKRLDLIDKSKYNLLWVTEFPLLEYDRDEKRYTAKHHPFTSPVDEDIDILETAPEKARAKAYDIIMNGCELGGGSIRIHNSDLQALMFRTLGFTDEDAYERFGHLLDAFKYGAPPHGGLAYGLDRLCMLLSGHDSIRDVIAFPKVQNASELMTACPDFVDEKQLDELSISVIKEEE